MGRYSGSRGTNYTRTVTIKDQFLSPEGLLHIQTLCLSNKDAGEPFTDFDSELYLKCQTIFEGSCTNAMIYRIKPNTMRNPHKDPKKWSTVFYPFASDGPLGIWNDNHTIKELIEVKENRLVAYESGKTMHSQDPPSQGIRYSVAFHWSVSS